MPRGGNRSGAGRKKTAATGVAEASAPFIADAPVGDERNKLIKELRARVGVLEDENASLKRLLAEANRVRTELAKQVDPIDATGVDLRSGRGKVTVAIPEATGRPCIHGGIHGRCVRAGCRPA